MEALIQVKNATKYFKKKRVFESVHLKVKQGEMIGIVGKNGSGKTILFKTILGFLPLNDGEVIVNGEVVGKDIDIPKDVGIMIENPGFLYNKSAFDNLKLLALINNKISDQEINEAIEKVGLDAANKDNVSTYSLGMRQRLGIAQAIMEKPAVLILDEPLNGLDSTGVEEMRQLLLDIKESGTAILLTSHNKEDIKVLCDQVYKFEDGFLLAETTE
ncbi:ATP-binding cassette domain-containing protein [Aerococcaceae bacterium zg-BR22]|uniref:ATP-binding cassette domain-containing protein n=1 Tax=Aerococcaceae bacterium zg-1292 TaxID=2774330 RepID=UPI004063B756|nr:ATP-binding cassette domain-containing protein [Aerococcaceae bacterium zg-BR22]